MHMPGEQGFTSTHPAGKMCTQGAGCTDFAPLISNTVHDTDVIFLRAPQLTTSIRFLPNVFLLGTAIFEAGTVSVKPCFPVTVVFAFSSCPKLDS